MTVQSITLNVPETLYEQIRRVAQHNRRSVDDIMLEAIMAVVPVAEANAASLHSPLAQMAYLNDAALWQASRTAMSADQRERLALLHDKQQREGLTDDERAEEQALLQLYRETMLVRAQAVAVLKQRNYDVSNPAEFQPLV